MMTSFNPRAAADILLQVRAGGPRAKGLPITPPDAGAAYQVQDAVLRSLGGPISWKVALLDGRERHAAGMPASEIFANRATVAGLPPDAAIEVETAFILGHDLRPDCDVSDILAAIGEVRLAFEIIGSRFADPTTVSPLAAMADSFSSAAIVLGDTIPDWRSALDEPLGLSLVLNDKEVLATEQAPKLAETTDFLIWLATHAAAHGFPLSAGDVIISGSDAGGGRIVR